MQNTLNIVSCIVCAFTLLIISLSIVSSLLDMQYRRKNADAICEARSLSRKERVILETAACNGFFVGSLQPTKCLVERGLFIPTGEHTNVYQVTRKGKRVIVGLKYLADSN